MKTLIIYAHPWDGSFNHHVLQMTIEKLEAKGEHVDVIDLHKDEFNPVMHVSDLKVFAKGEYADPKAEDYVHRLKAADKVIFIFPIWWYGLPAILKGFMDKILLKGTTYTQDSDHNLLGLLDIKESAVFTTANIDKVIFKNIGDPIENVMIAGIFATVGIENTRWIHCDTVHLEESRNEYLAELNEYLSE
ncbi:MAG: flavodoxin family protein [Erysipelothrix sp.]|nr:flavodoxin family protein [Erysipelothrix sp.]